MKSALLLILCSSSALFSSCSSSGNKEPKKAAPPAATPAYFKVDPATAGSLSGTVRFTGKAPAKKIIDMSGDPACVEAHHGKAYGESLVVNGKGDLANVFVYVKSGLEGKTFETPTTPVMFDQRGCWFSPRVFGIQAGQPLQISNSDPVTHNVHPIAQVNREWNHSQGPGDAPLARKFHRLEVMIPVKCNIHSWMHAFIGVLDHPYFAVSGPDGAFAIPNLPPGDYVVEAWHEKLGVQQVRVSVAPSAKQEIGFTFKGE
ncbi:MAG TPA: hypothetical protein VKU19_18155 [Bryobacteraceae bacterium]|nr:hypothetical protein [Bryobacteraceae bacterium]